MVSQLLPCPSLKLKADVMPMDLDIFINWHDELVQLTEPMRSDNFRIKIICCDFDFQKRIFTNYDFVILSEYRADSLREASPSLIVNFYCHNINNIF